jgi:hypothetical protein
MIELNYIPILEKNSSENTTWSGRILISEKDTEKYMEMRKPFTYRYFRGYTARGATKEQVELELGKKIEQINEVKA